MQEDFDKSLHFILQAEGGYSDTPGDSGGPTNMGIEQPEYTRWLAEQKLPDANIRDITVAQAGAIYKSKYWDPLKGDFVSYPLCFVLFDSGVNCGIGMAFEWLNKALGLPGVREWTDDTSTKYHALTATDVTATADHILVLRHEFYVQLAADHPHDQQFLNGWLARITHLKAAAGLT